MLQVGKREIKNSAQKIVLLFAIIIAIGIFWELVFYPWYATINFTWWQGFGHSVFPNALLFVAYAVPTIIFIRWDKFTLADLKVVKVNIPLQLLTFVLGMGLIRIIWFLVSPWSLNLPIGPIQVDVGFYYDDFPDLALNIAYLVFFIFFNAGVEELLFRGYIQGKLAMVCNKKWVPAVISAALFALYHFPAGGLQQMAFTFFAGLAWGYLRAYWKYATLPSLILMHGIYNGMFVLVDLFSQAFG